MNMVLGIIAVIVAFIIGYAIGVKEERQRMIQTMKRENLTIRERKRKG